MPKPRCRVVLLTSLVLTLAVSGSMPGGLRGGAGSARAADGATEILVGHSGDATGVAAAASGSNFLVAFEKAPRGQPDRVVARRFASDGSPLDARPFVVSDQPSGATRRHGQSPAATGDSAGFYVAWESSGALGDLFVTHLRGRAVASSGAPDLGAAASFGEYQLFGTCHVQGGGPIRLAPGATPGTARATFREAFVCLSDTLLENIVGLGSVPFAPPFPGYASVGPAPLASGTSATAAAWWGGYLDDPPSAPTHMRLSVTWLDDSTTFPLVRLRLSRFTGIAPAVAAAGDVFLAAWTVRGSHLVELRARRFGRSSGPLDRIGGFLLARTPHHIQEISAAGGATGGVVAWSESTGDGTSAIRALRFTADGKVADMWPLDLVASGAGAPLSVAVSPSAAMVVYTRPEGSRTVVRAILLPSP